MSVLPHQLAPAALALLLPPLLGACSQVEKAGPQPTPAEADTTITLDVPQIMRGTVASETVILGYPQAGNWSYSSLIVRGYGLVVGLGGTGSRDVEPALRAHMLSEIRRQGFGRESLGWGDLEPEALLDSPDTAVVIVEAIVPPGAVKNAPFDVRVIADPRTGTSSLEGGILYTTDLRPEPGALRVGGGQKFPVAQARGPIFINPFTEPRAGERSSVILTTGRILNGGVLIKDMPLKLRLVTPGHARAARIRDAINTHFPQENGQHDATARGESDESIVITVPPSWHHRVEEFVALMQHTTIRTIAPESVAVSVRRTLEAVPETAPAAALRWQALGVKVLPIVRDLYEAPDELVRLAALTAGARLDDPLAVPNLIEMTHRGLPKTRLQAVELLTGMRLNPQIDQALRDLVNDEFLEVRLQAYEALAQREDPYMQRLWVDGKFILDVLDSQRPMLYITQRGQPRIVLFGRDLAVQRPLVMAAWSNRLMLNGSAGEGTIELYYREADDAQGDIHQVEPGVEALIPFLARKTTPENPQTGLNLSYSETVGALHQIWQQGHLPADFKAEQDRIAAAIILQEKEQRSSERPDFAEPSEQWFTPGEAAEEGTGSASAAPDGQR